MSPFQHGEVYVTDDGAETDLDLGPLRALHARRASAGKNNFTTGDDLRDGHPEGAARRLPGRTVQVIPHITDEIKRRIRAAAERRRRRASSRSAARSATSSRCRSSRRSASSG